MLVYSEERRLPTSIDTIMLFDGTGYYYLDRTTYDKAVVLSHMMNGDISIICSKLGLQILRNDISFFYDRAPEPLKALAPFLSMVTEPLEDYNDMLGALHVITTVLDCLRLLEVDPSIRTSAEFSSAIKIEYKVQWESYLATTLLFGAPQPIQYVSQQPAQQASVVTENKEYTEEEIKDAFNNMDEDALLDLLNSEFDLSEFGITGNESNSLTEEESKPEPEPVKKALSGLELVSMM